MTTTIPPDREAALRKLGAQIGLKEREPTAWLTGIRLSEADHRLWMQLSATHKRTAGETMSVMIAAYLEEHPEDFRWATGDGKVLPKHYGRFQVPRHLAEAIRDRCKERQVSISDCLRQIIAWTSGLLD
jgi:hypothetical protein